MKHLKRLERLNRPWRAAAALLALAMIFVLAACGNGSRTPATDRGTDSGNGSTTARPDVNPSGTGDGTDATAMPSGTKTLVVYFSRTGEQYTVGVIDKGNTAIVAEMIAEQTGADLFEVLPADDHYPMTYDALTDVAKQEQNDNARPAYSGELPNLDGYSRIFIGAPV